MLKNNTLHSNDADRVITHVKKRMMFLITHFCNLGLKNDIHEYQIYKKKIADIYNNLQNKYA